MGGKPVLMLGWTWEQAREMAQAHWLTIDETSRQFEQADGRRFIFNDGHTDPRRMEYAWIMLGPGFVSDRFLALARPCVRTESLAHPKSS